MKLRDYICITYLFVLLVSIVGCQSETNIKKGLSPKEALSTFELRPSFNIQLVASEPLISDPVDMMIDENGDLYVVEMHGYNLGKKTSGIIKRLRDTNGDGRMDERTIFADSLRLPTGIMSWKEGVLVTAPPDVWYLRDNDGDGHADNKKKMLTGFDTSNAEANVNNPMYGLDNGIYLANMLASDSDIFYAKQSNGPRLPKGANGQDVRFRPDSTDLKMVSGQSQFGHTFDQWGHRFLVSAANPIYQEVVANRYLQRNKDLLVSNATQSLHQSRNVFPITKNPQNQLLTDAGVFTAASGLTAYEGGAFPNAFDTSAFVAEPAHNLVRAFNLQVNGPSYMAKPFQENKEFLASTDAWFRPVNMYVGPDGALYVVDYYREIIEGFAWLSKDVQESEKIPNGSNQGRIYRITSEGAKPPVWTKGLNLEETSNKQLIKKLADPNIWWRRNAQRLLVDRADEKTVSSLEHMARQSSSAVGRLHALWTLEGIGKLKPTIISHALKDTVAGVRENAIKLAELHLNNSPSLIEPLLAMQSDSNAKVRFQLLCTLGFVDTPQAAHVRQVLLFENIDNKWMQIAALSAPASQNTDLLKTVVRRFKPSYSSLVERLSAMQAANQESERVHILIKKATSSESGEGWQAPMLNGIAKGLRNRQNLHSFIEEDKHQLLKTFFENPSAAVRQGCLQVFKVTGLPDGTRTQAAMQRASNIVGKKNISVERRVEALHFLMLDDPDPYASLLKRLVISQEPVRVQIAAVQALSDISSATVSRFVLKHWSTMESGVRDAALASFLVRPFELDRIQLLLDAIEKGKIQSTSLSWPQKVTLMRDTPDSLKRKARSLLARDENQNIDEYVKAVKQKIGDPEKGRLIYLQNCAICHQIGNTNSSGFGPNLRTVNSWETSAIIENTVDPNKSIAKGYSLWRVELKNGKVQQGIISNETSNAVTLRNQLGEEMNFARQNISSLKSLHVSPMPTGFKNKITPQEMANLVAFIQNTK